MEKLIPVQDEKFLYRSSNGSIINTDDETRNILRTKRQKEKTICHYMDELNNLKSEMSSLKNMLENLITTIQKQ